ncbi:hypothetical protein U1Q18_000281 [Sarracenia purpurea var. burkii]
MRFIWTKNISGFCTAIATGFDHKLNEFSISKAPKTLSLDRGLVDEQILTAIVGCNETKFVLIVEPLSHPYIPLSPINHCRALHHSTTVVVHSHALH